MSEWTRAQVEERLEEAAWVMRRLPPVRVQGYFNAWPEYRHSFGDQVGQEATMKAPRAVPAVDRPRRGGAALAALAGEGRRPAALAPRRPEAVEADLLGAGDQSCDREPAMAVRRRGDRLAAEREAGADKAFAGALIDGTG